MSDDLSILLVTGEASGDMHGANLVRSLKKRSAAIHVTAMGGEALKKCDIEFLYDHRNIAVLGLFEVIKHYPEIRRALNTLKTHLKRHKPDLLVLIDYAEFNLKLAETAKKLGIPVLFYISPKFWAWREKRVYRIKRLVDMMAVIFPFEVSFYEKHNVPVRYVGNPLTGKVNASADKPVLLERYNPDNKSPVVSLLPGSRRGEITRLLPVFIKAADKLRAIFPDIRFLLPLAPGIASSNLADMNLSVPNWIEVIEQGHTYDILAISDAAMIFSGTATLEAALMRTPMVVGGKISAASYAILSRMVKIKDLSLANIVAEDSIVKEFIQHEATGSNIAKEVERLIKDDAYRQRQLDGYDDITTKLGNKDGSEHTADLIVEMLTATDINTHQK